MAVKKGPRTQEQIKSLMHETLALDYELDGFDLRVFLYMSTRVGFDEFTHIPQVELATVLNRRKQHVSRSISRLIERGFIEQSDEKVRSSKWRLNPDYGR